MPQTKSQTVQVQSVPGATIAFSSDETFVAVTYNGTPYNIRRPVVSPWTYTTAGHTWWVSPTGSDSAAGTQSAPFATANHAIGVAAAGDIIYLLPGVYVPTASIVVNKANLTLSAAPKSAGGGLGTALIQPPASMFSANPPSVPVFSVQAANPTINGLVIQGALAAGVMTPEHYDQCGVAFVANGGTAARITNNVCWGHAHCGIKDVSGSAVNYLLEGNLCFGNGSNGQDHGIYLPSSFMTVNGNVCFANVGAGIQIYGSAAAHNLISHNILFGNAVWGILAAARYSHYLGNVMYGGGVQTIGLMLYRNLCAGNVFSGNISAGNTHYDVSQDDGGGLAVPPYDNMDNYNCWQGALYPGVPGLYSVEGAKNVRGQNPLFNNPATGDFGLQAGSPCIGAGDPAFAANMGAF